MTQDPREARSRATGAFEIVNQRGLHARAATKLVKCAASFPCEITLSSAEAEAVNAKSVMGVLLLCGARGTIVEVVAEGTGADEAVEAIGQIIRDKFGEEE